MVGIYQYEEGLKFTGVVAETRENAEEYLKNKYGKILNMPTGERDEQGKPLYEERFVPGYNKEAFKIMEITLVL